MTDLVAVADVAANRLRDAVRRDDKEDIVRIVNGLSLLEARALVGGLAVVAFKEES